MASENALDASNANPAYNHGALATIDDNAILDRIAAGEYAAHIAPELGVSKQALQRRLSKHAA